MHGKGNMVNGKKWRRRSWLVVGVALLMVGVAAAATVWSFTQTGPSTTAPTAGMTTTCSTLTYNDADSIFVGGDGIAAVLDCSGSPAVNLVLTGTYSYTATLPATTTDAWLEPTAKLPLTSGNCATIPGGGAIELVAGSETVPVSGGFIGPYDYCFDMTQGASFSGFTITWSS